MNLSAHFTLEEMTASQTAARHSIDNTPDAEARENLKRVAALLESVRALFGRPIRITSGYRCPELNQRIGSGATSQHIVGCAADFKVDGLPPDRVIGCIVAANIRFDQLIREFDSWVHISIPNSKDGIWRKQALIIDAKGTRKWLSPS